MIGMDPGIRFLVASDVHLGHRQTHPIRQNDSFEGFQEVMAHAKSQEVDFLLLGGDLFDEVNPSKECFFRCLNTLRENVFGSKNSRRSELQVTLNGAPYRSNMDDPGLKVSLPIFTIHGNHDYPSNDFGRISACDLLQASNYVNYFGKHLNLKQITIRPLIITKTGSNARIALYGLGYIKDQILNEMFEQNKVEFEKPEGGTEGCLCLFVFHQNRYKKGFRAGAPIHQTFNPRNIPQWMGLIIWGHQHEAIYKLQFQYDRPIFQPGSTVLTSFIESQALKKQCLLVEVAPTAKFELTSILLERSYRPMRCLALEYQELKDKYGQDFNLFTFLEGQIQEILNEIGGSKHPIVRIKMECTGLADTMPMKQVEAKFADRLANREKIILLWRRKIEQKITIDDKDILNNIRKKQPLQLSVTATHIDTILQSHTEAFTNNQFIPRQKFLEMNSYLCRVDNINPSEIISKKLSEMEKAKLNQTKKQIKDMQQDKTIELNKAYKHLYDRIQSAFEDKYDPQKYHYATKQEFLTQKDKIINPRKFDMHCKMMEEVLNQYGKSTNTSITNTNPSISTNEKNYPIDNHNNNSNTSNKSIINSKTASALSSHLNPSYPTSSHPSYVSHSNINTNPKISKQEEIDSSFEATFLSEEEDCCSRAEKIKADVQGNRMKFEQANERAKNISNLNKKKPALISSKQEVKSEHRNSKNVHFTRDFM